MHFPNLNKCYEKKIAAEVGSSGTGMVSYRMKVSQDEDIMFLKKYNIIEWGDDRIANEEVRLDGQEMKSVFWNSPRISIVNWNKDSGSMRINSKITFTREGQSTEMKSSEEWSLSDDGSDLMISQESTGFRGGQQVLQQDTTITIWGWGKPNEVLKITGSCCHTPATSERGMGGLYA